MRDAERQGAAMGLRIGNNLPAMRAMRTSRGVSNAGRFTARSVERSAALLPSPPKPELATIGFGAGTVNIATAALRAVDRTVEDARKLIPRLEEQMQRVRERAAEQRARSEEARVSSPSTVNATTRLQVGAENSATAARRFLDAFEQVETALARESDARQNSVSIRAHDTPIETELPREEGTLDVRL